MKLIITIKQPDPFPERIKEELIDQMDFPFQMGRNYLSVLDQSVSRNSFEILSISYSSASPSLSARVTTKAFIRVQKPNSSNSEWKKYSFNEVFEATFPVHIELGSNKCRISLNIQRIPIFQLDNDDTDISGLSSVAGSRNGLIPFEVNSESNSVACSTHQSSYPGRSSVKLSPNDLSGYLELESQLSPVKPVNSSSSVKVMGFLDQYKHNGSSINRLTADPLYGIPLPLDDDSQADQLKTVKDEPLPPLGGENSSATVMRKVESSSFGVSSVVKGISSSNVISQTQRYSEIGSNISTTQLYGIESVTNQAPSSSELQNIVGLDSSERISSCIVDRKHAQPQSSIALLPSQTQPYSGSDVDVLPERKMSPPARRVHNQSSVVELVSTVPVRKNASPRFVDVIDLASPIEEVRSPVREASNQSGRLNNWNGDAPVSAHQLHLGCVLPGSFLEDSCAICLGSLADTALKHLQQRSKDIQWVYSNNYPSHSISGKAAPRGRPDAINLNPDGSEVAVLPCKHAYCLSCIQRWSENESSCCFCKKAFSRIFVLSAVYARWLLDVPLLQSFAQLPRHILLGLPPPEDVPPTSRKSGRFRQQRTEDSVDESDRVLSESSDGENDAKISSFVLKSSAALPILSQLLDSESHHLSAKAKQLADLLLPQAGDSIIYLVSGVLSVTLKKQRVLGQDLNEDRRLARQLALDYHSIPDAYIDSDGDVDDDYVTSSSSDSDSSTDSSSDSNSFSSVEIDSEELEALEASEDDGDGVRLVEKFTLCEECKSAARSDVLLVCDACTRLHHTFCLTPPLDAVPDGLWICPECERSAAAQGLQKGIFVMQSRAERTRRIAEAALRSSSSSNTEAPQGSGGDSAHAGVRENGGGVEGNIEQLASHIEDRRRRMEEKAKRLREMEQQRAKELRRRQQSVSSESGDSSDSEENEEAQFFDEDEEEERVRKYDRAQRRRLRTQPSASHEDAPSRARKDRKARRRAGVVDLFADSDGDSESHLDVDLEGFVVYSDETGDDLDVSQNSDYFRGLRIREKEKRRRQEKKKKKMKRKQKKMKLRQTASKETSSSSDSSTDSADSSDSTDSSDSSSSSRTFDDDEDLMLYGISKGAILPEGSRRRSTANSMERMRVLDREMRQREGMADVDEDYEEEAAPVSSRGRGRGRGRGRARGRGRGAASAVTARGNFQFESVNIESTQDGSSSGFNRFLSGQTSGSLSSALQSFEEGFANNDTPAGASVQQLLLVNRDVGGVPSTENRKRRKEGKTGVAAVSGSTDSDNGAAVTKRNKKAKISNPKKSTYQGAVIFSLTDRSNGVAASGSGVNHVRPTAPVPPPLRRVPPPPIPAPAGIQGIGGLSHPHFQNSGIVQPSARNDFVISQFSTQSSHSQLGAESNVVSNDTGRNSLRSMSNEGDWWSNRFTHGPSANVITAASKQQTPSSNTGTNSNPLVSITSNESTTSSDYSWNRSRSISSFSQTSSNFNSITFSNPSSQSNSQVNPPSNTSSGSSVHGIRLNTNPISGPISMTSSEQLAGSMAHTTRGEGLSSNINTNTSSHSNTSKPAPESAKKKRPLPSNVLIPSIPVNTAPVPAPKPAPVDRTSAYYNKVTNPSQSNMNTIGVSSKPVPSSGDLKQLLKPNMLQQLGPQVGAGMGGAMQSIFSQSSQSSQKPNGTIYSQSNSSNTHTMSAAGRPELDVSATGKASPHFSNRSDATQRSTANVVVSIPIRTTVSSVSENATSSNPVRRPMPPMPPPLPLNRPNK